MSNLPISSKYRSTPHLPVDDREREQVVARVNEAFADGKLDDWNYRRLLDTAFAAKTLGEMAPVVEQLPAHATHNQPAIVEQGGGRPGELSESRPPANKTVATVIGGVAIGIVLLVVLLLLVF